MKLVRIIALTAIFGLTLPYLQGCDNGASGGKVDAGVKTQADRDKKDKKEGN